MARGRARAKAELGDQLRALLLPRAEELVAEVAALIAAKAEASWASASSAAVTKLRAELAGAAGSADDLDDQDDDGQLEEPARRTKTTARSRTPRPERTRSPAPKIVSKASSKPSCSRCGEPGHNSRTCGRTPTSETPRSTPTPLRVASPPSAPTTTSPPPRSQTASRSSRRRLPRAEPDSAHADEPMPTNPEPRGCFVSDSRDDKNRIASLPRRIVGREALERVLGFSLDEADAGELAELETERPRTRADCAGGPRPCPFVGCRHHLYLEVSARTGTLHLHHAGVPPWEMQHSCALDIADEGPHTLEHVGSILNLTRERTRQIERSGLDAAHAASRPLGLRPDDVDAFFHPPQSEAA